MGRKDLHPTRGLLEASSGEGEQAAPEGQDVIPGSATPLSM